MHKSIVGGPLVGDIRPIVSNDYIFLPLERRVTVRSTQTGQALATLRLPHRIHACTLLTKPRTVQDFFQQNQPEDRDRSVLLVTCADGSLNEFDLDQLEHSSVQTTTTSVDLGGGLRIQGPVITPTRSQMMEFKIRHLTQITTTQGRVVLFALNTIKVINKDVPSTKQLARMEYTDKDNNYIVENVEVLDENVKNMPSQMSSIWVNGIKKAFVLLTNSKGVTSYVISLNENTVDRLNMTTPEKQRITSVALSPNGRDVAYGYYSGKIVVQVDLLPLIAAYHKAMHEKEALVSSTSPRLPQDVVVRRRLHWHAHPVTALSYNETSSGAEPLLYSGAEESVLITWQLARGADKPVNTLPRIALGGITHVVACSHGIFVACHDNSIHWFGSHNYARMWKIQGLGMGFEDKVSPVMGTDTTTPGQVLITGMNNSPGCIHWYHPNKQQVTSTLEVAKFNRVSRTEPGDAPMPRPTVTHLSLDMTSTHMLTVDTFTTENDSIGISTQLIDGKIMSTVTTLKFWSNRLGQRSFRMDACMDAPHGHNMAISAAGLCPDGMFACTTSKDEKAMRIWARVISGNEEIAPAWICRFKISTPASLSAYEVGGSAVSFSSDSSLLAVAHRTRIALWSHTDATLLFHLPHLDNDSHPIKGLKFISSSSVSDLLFSYTKSSVVVQSPFGTNGPQNVGWAWRLPRSNASSSDHILFADALPQQDIIVIVIYNKTESRTTLTLVDLLTGKFKLNEHTSRISLSGKAKSLASTYQPTSTSGWGTGWKKADTEIVKFVVMMDSNELVLVNSSDDMEAIHDGRENRESAPTLSAIASVNLPMKRQRSVITLDDLETIKRSKMTEAFGTMADGEQVDSSDLPLLRGIFVQAFLGRNLMSKNQ